MSLIRSILTDMDSNIYSVGDRLTYTINMLTSISFVMVIKQILC